LGEELFEFFGRHAAPADKVTGGQADRTGLLSAS
jgi:hypothetical protein